MVFLLSVFEKRTKEPSYLLDDPATVISRIPLHYFSQLEALNYSLFETLINDYGDQKKYAEKTNRLVKCLKENKQGGFVVEYSRRLENLSVDENWQSMQRLVAFLGWAWRSFFADVSPSIFLKPFHNAFLARIGEDERRTKNLDDASITIFVHSISNDSKFFSEPFYDNNIAAGLKFCGVKFVSIDTDSAWRDSLRLAYQNNSYVINRDNIETMLELFYDNVPAVDWNTANYSAIMSEPGSPLAKYVNANIDDYITIILAECNGVIMDTAENVVLLLNNENIAQDKKVEYITFLQTTIEKLDDIISTDLWQPLLKNPTAVEYSPENILAYFDRCLESDFDDVLIEYLNRQERSFIILGKDSSSLISDTQKEFFEAVIRAIDLSDEIYGMFVELIFWSHANFNVEGLSLEKIGHLGNAGVIQMNADTLKFIRAQYPNYTQDFILQNFGAYIDLISEGELYVRDEVLAILDCEIEDSMKIDLLNAANDVFSVKSKDFPEMNKNYSDLLIAHILGNNFDERDLRYLLANYSAFKSQAQKAVLSITIDNMHTLLQEVSSCDRKLIVAMLESNNIDVEYKRELFQELAPTASDDEIKQWLPLINNNEFIVLFDENKRPRFDDVPWNRVLLDLFKGRKLIEDWHLHQNTQKLHITRGRVVTALARKRHD